MRLCSSYEELPDILTAKDLQFYLRISRSAAYELLNSQGFPTFFIGKSKRVRKDSLVMWIKSKEKSA